MSLKNISAIADWISGSIKNTAQPPQPMSPPTFSIVYIHDNEKKKNV